MMTSPWEAGLRYVKHVATAIERNVQQVSAVAGARATAGVASRADTRRRSCMRARSSCVALNSGAHDGLADAPDDPAAG